MGLNITLATLAFLSLGLTLWQWIVAIRFPVHRRVTDKDFSPPVTLLKPLKGADVETWRCLESWLTQNYPGPVQILFGAASADDPACEIVRQLIAAHPQQEARLVICAQSLGANSKVSTLIQLHRQSPQPVVVVSDNAWRRRFANVPNILGQTVKLNGQPFTIVAKTFPGTHPCGIRILVSRP